ncbi:hypothetical protein MBM_01042 [Drepanopeziza brunnea f. sp. 'multigermtubi' MB_m1]|uniref:Uncharacterized protein n=1 Tax=Marssonina brunnea f. sp. multigermtubi (strain MB_m1) TaxID=1072389 RepID=K1WRT1_MARBU|nr:uncharacterized protein MBM_01042 [Drepanopeziza brunnea f. sp. 'multigermtubi' MB_m1]EKD20360.1 hypothetical protein MBM_01042 [Drepanopeziza brunnea f. sp. 'multigermtubi' MB_m1]
MSIPHPLRAYNASGLSSLESSSSVGPPGPFHNPFPARRARSEDFVYNVSHAGLFPPLSRNTYFPALKEMATDLKVSLSLFSLTVAVYMMGQSMGPFLSGLGAFTLLLIVALLPRLYAESQENGTLRLSSIHRPVIYSYKEPYPSEKFRDVPACKNVTASSIVAPLKLLFAKDVVFVTVTTALFRLASNLSVTQVGLIFLLNGAGCVAGPYLTGYLTDYDYEKVEAQYRNEHDINADAPLNKKELVVDSAVEKSRLMKHLLKIIAVPALSLQFFIAYTATAGFSLNSERTGR